MAQPPALVLNEQPSSHACGSTILLEIFSEALRAIL
jgi:hypothetical protein